MINLLSFKIIKIELKISNVSQKAGEKFLFKGGKLSHPFPNISHLRLLYRPSNREKQNLGSIF